MNSEEQKNKNILDLEYNSLLNYMNILLISLATLIISLWVGLPKIIDDKETNSILLVVITLFLIISGILCIWFFNIKLDKKKKEIKKLKQKQLN